MVLVNMRTDELSRAVSRLVADVGGIFEEMGLSDWTRSRGDEAWTRLEILGHLIDSATNNHQRIVRAIAEGDLSWPCYDQEAMVRVQEFAGAPPAVLIGLWTNFNLHLARLMALIPAERLTARIVIGRADAVTLEFLVKDYIVHMQHHLKQIFEGMIVGVRWVELQEPVFAARDRAATNGSGVPENAR